MTAIQPSQEIRDAARQEAAEARSHSAMSEAATERLHHDNYEDRVRKQCEEKFSFALTQIAPTPGNLSNLIVRCVGNSKPKDLAQLDRRLHKLLFWIQGRGYRLGHEIRLPEDIAFLRELTPDEIVMSPARFLAEWKVDKIVPPRRDGPEPRYCDLGRKCLKAVKGKAAVVIGTSNWCSVVCRGRAKIIAKKAASATTSSESNHESCSLRPA